MFMGSVWHVPQTMRYGTTQTRTATLIVSKDADIHERSLLAGHPPKVIWIRRGNCSTTQILKILENHADDIEALGDNAESGVLILF